MSTGINYELDFEKHIAEMQDRPLLEFIARQTFEITCKCKRYDKSIAALETGDRKASGIMGGIAGTITAAIIGVINYFTVNRGQ